MKLLFDENLSFRLARELGNVCPESAHVRDVGLLGAGELRIWEHAAERDFVLVSKDTDFYQRSVAHGGPPKVIWLRVGNVPTSSVADLSRGSKRLVHAAGGFVVVGRAFGGSLRHSFIAVTKSHTSKTATKR